MLVWVLALHMTSWIRKKMGVIVWVVLANGYLILFDGFMYCISYILGVQDGDCM